MIQLACACCVLKVTELLEHRKIRRDEQNLFRCVTEIFFACVLSVWPPVLVASYAYTFDARQSLDARTFFAWWAWLAFGMYSFVSIISLMLRSLGEAGGMAAHGVMLVISLVSSSAMCVPLCAAGTRPRPID